MKSPSPEGKARGGRGSIWPPPPSGRGEATEGTHSVQLRRPPCCYAGSTRPLLGSSRPGESVPTLPEPPSVGGQTEGKWWDWGVAGMGRSRRPRSRLPSEGAGVRSRPGQACPWDALTPCCPRGGAGSPGSACSPTHSDCTVLFVTLFPSMNTQPPENCSLRLQFLLGWAVWVPERPAWRWARGGGGRGHGQ